MGTNYFQCTWLPADRPFTKWRKALSGKRDLDISFFLRNKLTLPANKLTSGKSARVTKEPVGWWDPRWQLSEHITWMTAGVSAVIQVRFNSRVPNTGRENRVLCVSISSVKGHGGAGGSCFLLNHAPGCLLLVQCLGPGVFQILWTHKFENVCIDFTC